MLRSRALAFMFAALVTPSAFAAPLRIAFTRVVPAPRDLGNARDLAVVFAIGDNDKVALFIDHFVEYAARSGQLHIMNGVDNNQHMATFEGKSFADAHKRYRADAYAGISMFTCDGVERSGDVGDKDADGKKTRTKVQWLDAVCSAKIDIRDGEGRRLHMFTVHGEGTSPRVISVGDDERDIAFDQATRYAALSAAESIAPRLIREVLELDDTAPAYEDGIELVRADRLAALRELWESRLGTARDSAALHYNLAIVAEAMRDVAAAHEYFATAARVAPKSSRYRLALTGFRKRNNLSR